MVGGRKEVGFEVGGRKGGERATIRMRMGGVRERWMSRG